MDSSDRYTVVSPDWNAEVASKLQNIYRSISVKHFRIYAVRVHKYGCSIQTVPDKPVPEAPGNHCDAVRRCQPP